MHKYNEKILWRIASYCALLLFFMNLIFSIWIEYPDIKINLFFIPIVVFSLAVAICCRVMSK